MSNHPNNALEVAIIGGYGSGAIIGQALFDIAVSGGHQKAVGYLNDFENPGQKIHGLPVLGKFNDWGNLPVNTLFIAGIHSPKCARERYARIASLAIPESRWTTVVHPSATVASAARIGAGTYIGPNVAVMPGARIGNHCSLRAGCYISHDVTIGDFGFIGPNAVLNGRSEMGIGAHFGPGAVCKEDTKIGAYAVVGIGTVVTMHVSEGATVAGNAARCLSE